MSPEPRIRHDRIMNTGLTERPVQRNVERVVDALIGARLVDPVRPRALDRRSSPASSSRQPPRPDGRARAAAQPAAARRGGRLPRRCARPRRGCAVPVPGVGRARLRRPRVALLARRDRRARWSPAPWRRGCRPVRRGLRDRSNDARRRLAGSLLTGAARRRRVPRRPACVDRLDDHGAPRGLLAGGARMPVRGGRWWLRSATGSRRPPSAWSALIGGAVAATMNLVDGVDRYEGDAIGVALFLLGRRLARPHRAAAGSASSTVARVAGRQRRTGGRAGPGDRRRRTPGSATC